MGKILDEDNKKFNSIYDNIDTKNSLLINIPKQKIEEYATNCTKFDKTKEYFHLMYHKEPHTIRRSLILRDHPEVEKLFKDKEQYKTLIPVGVIHVIQLSICYLIYRHDFSWLSLVLFSAFIGAVINHALFALFHDITHFNLFKSMRLNQVAAIICNLPQIIPSAITFGRYHRDHHTFLGDVVKDPDIPTLFEIKMISTRFRKIVFLILMPVFYAIRPFFKTPKPMIFMEIVNIVSCVLWGFMIKYFFGIKALIYLVLCTYFGLSIHPVAAHLIGEHYEFFKSQDTFSYYGPLNWVNFNLGYHIEHHDFPNIPWHKLPEVSKIAPEYYNNLPQLHSYVSVYYKYLFDDDMGPWSRIVIEEKKSN